jgi:hypothetical protein
VDDEWRAGQQAGPAASAGQVRRLDEGVRGRSDVAAPVLSGREAQQHVTLTVDVEPAGRRLRQRQPVQAGRFLVPELVSCLAGGQPRVPGRSRPIAG